jgi:hypothetical protein
MRSGHVYSLIELNRVNLILTGQEILLNLVKQPNLTFSMLCEQWRYASTGLGNGTNHHLHC